jgi:hypothetical protein
MPAFQGRRWQIPHFQMHILLIEFGGWTALTRVEIEAFRALGCPAALDLIVVESASRDRCAALPPRHQRPPRGAVQESAARFRKFEWRCEEVLGENLDGEAARQVVPVSRM